MGRHQAIVTNIIFIYLSLSSDVFLIELSSAVIQGKKKNFKEGGSKYVFIPYCEKL